MRKVLIGVVALVVLVALIDGLSSKKKSPAIEGAANVGETTSAREPKADIELVTSKSFCIATGIDDVYTGNGHVEFFLTFTNTGDADGTVSMIPVRHYDDGQMNMSAMDEVQAAVPAGATKKFHTPQFKYKAHEHALDSCGAIVDGGDEVPIQSVGA